MKYQPGHAGAAQTGLATPSSRYADAIQVTEALAESLSVDAPDTPHIAMGATVGSRPSDQFPPPVDVGTASPLDRYVEIEAINGLAP